MNNKMVGTCKNCGQYYCQECSDNNDWMNYCSDKCEKEAEENGCEE
jgi:hypothetical protein